MNDQPTEKTIHPTGTCFDDAVHNAAEYARQLSLEEAHRDLVIVHAIICPPEHPQGIAHAWVEIPATKLVMFDGIVEGKREKFVSPIEEFYERMNVQESTRYTVQEAVERDREERSGGPWEEKYKRLTKEGKRRP